ncbi:methyltransferase [Neisseriaceae bacterium ESL0693]|nr:methyltransferase [Neisseriaceae bacterium ESL0693]
MTFTLSRQPDWFLHAYTASTLDERLALLRQPPQNIILAAADGNESYRLLKTRYPNAEFQEFDQRQDYLYWSLQARKAELNLWQKLSQPLPPQYPTDILPTDEAADMVWSNLGLIHQGDPAPIMENWADTLRPDGLLFFSHFGTDTLQELRTLWQKHDIIVNMPMFLDMHDLGDMLLQHGFYDPVTDMSKLTLQYSHAERFIADMQIVGLWQSLQFDDEETATRILVEHWPQKQLQNITLELVYGHGIKKQRLPEHTATVQFYPRPPHTPD